MSENMIRSGISSGFSFARSAAERICSHAASKSVEPPQFAPCIILTFSAILAQLLMSTHFGVDSKVSARSRNATCVSSATMIPIPIATSIGVPCMEPLTSTSGTSFPRSIALGSAALIALIASSPLLSPADSRTAASRASAALAIASRTPSRIASHCACIKSASTVERALQPAMHFCATSCGKSCFPLTAFAPLQRSASRKCCRAATRAGSSGWRFPVASCACVSLPLSASFRKAFLCR
mmetsp:Transcript_60760/g.100912  ORF Transcript_60760/g.100912 Transcript_60760/m.100912 type:complete len:239 (-) Transcript_60760:790-1506(-)